MTADRDPGAAAAPRTDLAELRRLEAAATPRPWIAEKPNRSQTGAVMIVRGDKTMDYVYTTYGPNAHKDATFISALRNAAPELLGAAESGASRHGPWCVKTGPDSATPIVHDEDCRRDDTPAESGASPAIPDGFEAKLTAALKDAYAAEVARLDHRLLYGESGASPAAEDRDLAALRKQLTDESSREVCRNCYAGPVVNGHRPTDHGQVVYLEDALDALDKAAALPHGGPARTPKKRERIDWSNVVRDEGDEAP